MPVLCWRSPAHRTRSPALSSLSQNDTKSFSSGYLTVARAHTMLARPYPLKSFTSHSAALARDMKSFSSANLTAANAVQCVGEVLCIEIVHQPLCRSRKKDMKSCSSKNQTGANAHAVLVRSDALDSFTSHSAALTTNMKASHPKT